MGWDMPWYSAQPSLDTLLVGREIGLIHLVCYLRDGDRVFETYWTNRRGVEAMDNSYALMDLTVVRAPGAWEDSPAGWPQERTNVRTDDGAPDVDARMAGRAPHRPVAAARGRPLGRPRHDYGFGAAAPPVPLSVVTSSFTSAPRRCRSGCSVCTPASSRGAAVTGPTQAHTSGPRNAVSSSSYRP